MTQRKTFLVFNSHQFDKYTERKYEYLELIQNSFNNESSAIVHLYDDDLNRIASIKLEKKKKKRYLDKVLIIRQSKLPTKKVIQFKKKTDFRYYKQHPLAFINKKYGSKQIECNLENDCKKVVNT